MEKLSWKTERRKVSDLIPWDQNPRVMSKKQAEDLQRSVEKFDLVEIPAINTDQRVLAGHQRLMILKLLGRENEEIDVRVPNRKLTESEATEYNLRSNKNIGEWNWDLLANMEMPMLKEVGFTKEELGSLRFPMLNDEDDVPEVPKEPKSKLGDLYQLGKHRVMCGDSTDPNAVRKLMNEEKADMVFTDPPYGVNYVGGSTNKKQRTDSYFDTFSDFAKFLTNALTNALTNSKENSALYLWFASSRIREVLKAIDGGGWKDRNLIFWMKLKAHYGALGAQYKHRHEPMFFCVKGVPKFYGSSNENTVWEVEQPRVNDLHPTMKPVELCERAIRNSSKAEDIVLDLFLGSGSTLIACQKTGRKCYGMEIDPRYVDVIIQRWETATGEKAKKL